MHPIIMRIHLNGKFKEEGWKYFYIFFFVNFINKLGPRPKINHWMNNVLLSTKKYHFPVSTCVVDPDPY